jgi:transposase
MLADSLGRPLRIVVTAGQAGDDQQAKDIIEDLDLILAKSV